MMTTFNQVKKRCLEKLELYVPVVDRVHGDSHPEFNDERRQFKIDNPNIKDTGP